jgi:hypothetical protein
MQRALRTRSRLTHPILGGILRLLPLLAVLLAAAVTHATPTQAATYVGCGHGTCVTLMVTLADGNEIRKPVEPADDEDEPDEDEVVHLVATTNANLAANTWRLQIVDLNGNLYADCGTTQPCQVFVWNDEDGQLFFQHTFVPDQKASPATPAIMPYGPDGHTVQFASRIVDANGAIVAQIAVPVVFEEGDEDEPDED